WTGNGHRARLEERAAGRAVREAGVGQVRPRRGVEVPALSGITRTKPRRDRRGQLAHLTGEARDLDPGVDEETAALPALCDLEEPPGEATDHPGAGQRAPRRRQRGVGVARGDAPARLQYLIARRRSADRADLDRAVVVAELDGVGEGVRMGVVRPSLHHPLVA